MPTMAGMQEQVMAILGAVKKIEASLRWMEERHEIGEEKVENLGEKVDDLAEKYQPMEDELVRVGLRLKDWSEYVGACPERFVLNTQFNRDLVHDGHPPIVISARELEQAIQTQWPVITTEEVGVLMEEHMAAIAEAAGTQREEDMAPIAGPSRTQRDVSLPVADDEPDDDQLPPSSPPPVQMPDSPLSVHLPLPSS